MLPILRSVISRSVVSRRSFNTAAPTNSNALKKLEKAVGAGEAAARSMILLRFPLPVIFGYCIYAGWEFMDTVEYCGTLFAYQEQEKMKRVGKAVKVKQRDSVS